MLLLNGWVGNILIGFGDKMAHTRSIAKYKDQVFDGLDSFPCCFCNCQLTRATATIEHIVPKHCAGHDKNYPYNLTLSCWYCNSARQVADFFEFRKYIQGFSDKIPVGANIKLLINKSKRKNNEHCCGI